VPPVYHGKGSAVAPGSLFLPSIFSPAPPLLEFSNLRLIAGPWGRAKKRWSSS